MLYRIEVKRQGQLIEHHIVEAVDAMAAINQVERDYGEPASFDFATIEDDHGRKRQVLIVSDWHGYTFEARLIRKT
jgi:hypothetical protein